MCKLRGCSVGDSFVTVIGDQMALRRSVFAPSVLTLQAVTLVSSEVNSVLQHSLRVQPCPPLSLYLHHNSFSNSSELYLCHSSFSNPSIASPMSRFILQPFFCFSYVTSSSLNSPGELSMVFSSNRAEGFSFTLLHILHIRYTDCHFTFQTGPENNCMFSSFRYTCV